MKREKLLLAMLFIVAGLTRFSHLGYSDYLGDEHKAFIRPQDNQSVYAFLLSQRKGPLQFFVSHIPYSLTGDFNNELAQRTPFALFSVSAVFIFFAFIKNLTKSFTIAYVSAFLFCINGFIVGFGRIAQYQNLNLFFSFAGLWLLSFNFYKERANKTKVFLTYLFAGLSFLLSFLAHWDAVFVVIPACYLVLRHFYFYRKEILPALLGLIVPLIILLGFISIYIQNYILLAGNQAYLDRRLGFGFDSIYLYKIYIELYNPFVFFPVLLACLGLTVYYLVKRKLNKTWMPLVLLWAVVNLVVFVLFVEKPGTHIYNFIIPWFVVMAYYYNELKGTRLRYLGIVILAFLTFQALIIFVDHTKEHPWERKYVGFLKTPQYTGRTTKGEILPLFGFPHYRGWELVNNKINELAGADPAVGEITYVTNEDTTVSSRYLSAVYGPSDNGYYLVAVKRPINFVNDWEFTQINNKKKVFEFRNNNQVVTRIYYVSPER